MPILKIFHKIIKPQTFKVCNLQTLKVCKGGNCFDKYHSRNLLVRFAVNRYLKTLNLLIKNHSSPPSKILDLGCGEGAIISRLKKYYPKAKFTGVDIDQKLITKLRRRFPGDKFRLSRLDRPNFSVKGEWDLVLCLETLEHVTDFRQALENLVKLNTESIIISVPREPWFRFANLLRFRYLACLGSTPGHRHYFTTRVFQKLINHYFSGKKIIFASSTIWNFAAIASA